MENIDNTTNTNPIDDFKSEEMKSAVSTVLKFVLYNLILYMLKLPYVLFKKATSRLVKQSEKGSLSIEQSNSEWPLLSFLKTYLLEFCLDASTFLSYVVGYPLIALFFILNLFESGYSFGDNISMTLAAAVGLYFAPLMIALQRDVFQILMLPFRKFIDWVKKPAQHMDINHSGDIKKS